MTNNAQTILDLVAQMERAKASGLTNSDQTEINEKKAYSVRYFDFVNNEIKRNPEFGINEVIDLHLIAIACGMANTGMPETLALMAGVGLGTRLLDHIRLVYKAGDPE